MIRHSSTAHETHPADLEQTAADWGVPIELPPGRAGWAYVTLPNGMRFKAWMPAPNGDAA